MGLTTLNTICIPLSPQPPPLGIINSIQRRFFGRIYFPSLPNGRHNRLVQNSKTKIYSSVGREGRKKIFLMRPFMGGGGAKTESAARTAMRFFAPNSPIFFLTQLFFFLEKFGEMAFRRGGNFSRVGAQTSIFLIKTFLLDAFGSNVAIVRKLSEALLRVCQVLGSFCSYAYTILSGALRLPSLPTPTLNSQSAP